MPRAVVSVVVVAAAALLVAARLGAGAGDSRIAPAPSIPGTLATSSRLQTAVFAGGCFWGIEGVYEHIKGVTSATSGYAGGSAQTASYDEVSSGTTDHAEAVQVVYDPSKVTYAQLLQVFFSVAHDPTQRNRQGPDVGPQYRSAVFYANDEQRKAAESYVADLTAAKTYPRPIVTEIVPLKQFFEAEEYHQDYMVKHPLQPYIVIHDAPKVENLRRQFRALYREREAVKS